MSSPADPWAVAQQLAEALEQMCRSDRDEISLRAICRQLQSMKAEWERLRDELRDEGKLNVGKPRVRDYAYASALDVAATEIGGVIKAVTTWLPNEAAKSALTAYRAALSEAGDKVSD